MTTLFIVLILIFITIAIWQMIKIFDLSRVISGVKIDDSQIANDKDNSTQAKLMSVSYTHLTLPTTEYV